MARKQSFSPAERRKLARQALQEGVDNVARKVDREPETVRRWMQEAGLSDNGSVGSSGGADALVGAIHDALPEGAKVTSIQDLIEGANNDPDKRGRFMDRHEAFVGADVEFGFGHKEKAGKIQKLNPKKAVVVLPSGESWNVSYMGLRHAREPVDIPDFDPTGAKQYNPDGLEHGDEVKFDHKGETFYGVVVKLNPTKAKVETSDGRIWVVPYALASRSDTSVEDAPKPPEVGPPLTVTSDAYVGDRVRFGREQGQKHYGTVERINPKTIKIKEDDTDKMYNVSPSLVRPIIEDD